MEEDRKGWEESGKLQKCSDPTRLLHEAQKRKRGTEETLRHLLFAPKAFYKINLMLKILVSLSAWSLVTVLQYSTWKRNQQYIGLVFSAPSFGLDVSTWMNSHGWHWSNSINYTAQGEDKATNIIFSASISVLQLTYSEFWCRPFDHGFTSCSCTSIL